MKRGNIEKEQAEIVKGLNQVEIELQGIDPYVIRKYYEKVMRRKSKLKRL